MRAKSEAQIYLEQYEMLMAKVECKLEEKQQMHDLALKITAAMGGERVQSSGAKDKIGNAVTACVDLENEIADDVGKLVAKQKEVAGTLERLENPTEYKLLHQRYIQFKQLKTIADNFNSSYDWATTTHGRALKSVQELLDAQ